MFALRGAGWMRLRALQQQTRTFHHHHRRQKKPTNLGWACYDVVTPLALDNTLHTDVTERCRALFESATRAGYTVDKQNFYGSDAYNLDTLFEPNVFNAQGGTVAEILVPVLSHPLSAAAPPGVTRTVTLRPARGRTASTKPVAIALSALHADAMLSHAPEARAQCFVLGAEANANSHPAAVLPHAPQLPPAFSRVGAAMPQTPDAQEWQQWAQYTAACARYTGAARRRLEAELLQLGRVGFYTLGASRHAEAAAVEAHRSAPVPALRTRGRLNNLLKAAGGCIDPEVLAVRLGGDARRTLAVLALPRLPHLRAIGIGANKNEAVDRCMQHAVQLMEHAASSAAAVASSPLAAAAAAAAKSAGASSASSAPAVGAGTMIPGARATVMAYARLLDAAPPEIIESATHDGCKCTVRFQGLEVSQIAYSRADACDLAFSDLYSLLQDVDPVVKDVAALRASHNQIDAGTIMDVRMDADACRAADVLFDKCMHLSGVSGDGDVEGRIDTAAATQSIASKMDQATADLFHRLFQDLGTRGAASRQQQAQVDRTTPLYREQAELMQRGLDAYRASPAYAPFAAARARLAMTKKERELLDLVKSNRVVILCGTTGCGKTTQVPQFLLDDAIRNGEGPDCKILVTQPRRISAMSIASRIASERLEQVGQSAGYTIRLESKPGRHINLLTTGVLLQLLRGNPSLEGVRYLIIDEIHDRDLHCDFALILARKVLAANPNIRVICMSATLQSELFSNYFGGAPVMNVDGMTFPVRDFYLEDLTDAARQAGSSAFDHMHGHNRFRRGRNGRYDDDEESQLAPDQPPKIDSRAVAWTVDHAVDALPPGSAVLVFVPGWKEITDVARAVQQFGRYKHRYHVLTLHSTVDSRLQLQVFDPPPPGKIKIVVATNIAESGVTIDDVGAVVDTGMIKEMSCLMRRGTSTIGRDEMGSVFRLQTAWASQANCTQRRGRAGRTKGGMCYRLYSRDTFERFRTFQVPEMLRQPLESVILQIVAMGYDDPRAFLQGAIEVPPPELIEYSIERLVALGAVVQASAATTPAGENRKLHLTPVGSWLAKMPTEPHLGKMILIGAVLQCLDSVLTVAASQDASALTTHRDAAKQVKQTRVLVGGRTLSDHVTDARVYDAILLRDRRVPPELVHQKNVGILQKYKEQFQRVLEQSGWFGNAAKLYKTSMRFGAPVNGGHVEASAHSDNNSLVAAAVSAGLYPNVAMLHSAAPHESEKDARKKQRRCLMSTKLHPGIEVSAKSVIRVPIRHLVKTKQLETALPSRLFVFDSVMKINRMEPFLSDVSNTSIWALLLLCAGHDHVQFMPQLRVGIVDGWLLFHTDAESMEAIRKIRACVAACFNLLLRDPGNEQYRVLLAELRRLLIALLASDAAKTGSMDAMDENEDEEDDTIFV